MKIRPKTPSLTSYVKAKFKLNNDDLETVVNKVRGFFKNFNKKLVKSGGSFGSLLRDPWMRGKIEIELKCKDILKRKVGRPSKNYEECAARTKRRKVQELCATVSQSQIEMAAVRTVKKPVARIVSQIIHSTVPQVREHCVKAARDDVIPSTTAEAVSTIVELDLTKHQFISLR